MIISIRLFIY